MRALFREASVTPTAPRRVFPQTGVYPVNVEACVIRWKCGDARAPNGVRARVNVGVFDPAPPFFRVRESFFVIVNPFCCCMICALP